MEQEEASAEDATLAATTASFHLSSLSPCLVFFLDLLKEVKQHLCPSTIQETERSWILLYWSIIYFSMTHHMGLEGCI